MARQVYIDFEKNIRFTAELKYDAPTIYAEQQEKLKEHFISGKAYALKTVYMKQCPTCKDTFYTITRAQIYDTSRCKDAAKRKRNKTTPLCYCNLCGCQFTPVRQDAMYCSNSCRQKAYRYRKEPR